MNQNTFINNSASVCGAVLYFKQLSPSNNYLLENVYNNSTASYGKDFCSFPTHIKLQSDNYDNIIDDELKIFKIIPGFTNLNLNFILLDFFDQETFDINNGFINLIYIK